jgi:hypothetical protein
MTLVRGARSSTSLKTISPVLSVGLPRLPLDEASSRVHLRCVEISFLDRHSASMSPDRDFLTVIRDAAMTLIGLIWDVSQVHAPSLIAALDEITAQEPTP